MSKSLGEVAYLYILNSGGMSNFQVFMWNTALTLVLILKMEKLLMLSSLYPA